MWGDQLLQQLHGLPDQEDGDEGGGWHLLQHSEQVCMCCAEDANIRRKNKKNNCEQMQTKNRTVVNPLLLRTCMRGLTKETST